MAETALGQASVRRRTKPKRPLTARLQMCRFATEGDAGGQPLNGELQRLLPVIDHADPHLDGTALGHLAERHLPAVKPNTPVPVIELFLK